jgi:hypothetical protein
MKQNTIPLPLLYMLSITLFLFTFFWGYCWNWWQTPWLQYFFQNFCPLVSEESRYPNNIDVLISGRYMPGTPLVVPNTSFLYYRSYQSNKIRNYLYDFEYHTTREIKLPSEMESPIFITGMWTLLDLEGPYSLARKAKYVLLNIETQNQIPLIEIKTKTPPSEMISDRIIRLLRQSDTIYNVNGFIVVLPQNIGDTTAPSYLVRGIHNSPDIVMGASETIESHLNTLGVKTINLNNNYSHDNSFYYDSFADFPRTALRAAIYESDAKTAIVTSLIDNALPVGWAYQQRGVILRSGITTYLIGGPSLAVGTPALFPVPQPILLLRQDPQYMSPDLQVQFATQDTFEQRNNLIGNIVMVGLVVLTFTTIVHTRRIHRLAHKETLV